MNIYEVLEYGPIVACDEDFGCLVTINGSYLNLWVLQRQPYPRGPESWTNTDCRTWGGDGVDLYKVTAAQAMAFAEAWLEEIRSPDGDDNAA